MSRNKPHLWNLRFEEVKEGDVIISRYHLAKKRIFLITERITHERLQVNVQPTSFKADHYFEALALINGKNELEKTTIDIAEFMGEFKLSTDKQLKTKMERLRFLYAL